MAVYFNCFLAIVAMFLCYQLALAYIGVTKKLRQVIFPVVIFTIITYISKFIFKTTPTEHTIVLVIACGLILWLINKSDLIISFIGSLLTFITVTLGSIMVWLPLLVKMGFNLPKDQVSIEWFLLNLFDFFTLILAIFLLRLTKFSILKIFNGSERV